MNENQKADEQFAEELARLFDAIEEYPEDARSIPQWMVADRLHERYAVPKHIPQIVADITGKSINTLQNYRATAAAWPSPRRRNYDVAFETHRSMNKVEDRFTRIHEVETRNDARILAGSRPSLGTGGHERRGQTAQTDEWKKEVKAALRDPVTAADVLSDEGIQAAVVLNPDVLASIDIMAKTFGVDEESRRRSEARLRSTRQAQNDAADEPIDQAMNRMLLRFSESLQTLIHLTDNVAEANRLGTELRDPEEWVKHWERLGDELRAYFFARGWDFPASIHDRRGS